MRLWKGKREAIMVSPIILIVVFWFVFLCVRRIRPISFFAKVIGGVLAGAGLLFYVLHLTQPFPHASGILFLTGVGMVLLDFVRWISGGRLRTWGTFTVILFVAVSLLTSFLFTSKPEISTEFLIVLIALNALLVTGECAVYAAIIGPVSEVLLFLRPYIGRLFDEMARLSPAILHFRRTLDRATDVFTYASESVFIFPLVLFPFAAAIFALLGLLRFEWFGVWAMMSFWLTVWHPIFLPSYFTMLLYESRRAKFSLDAERRAQVLDTEP
jgi:hypothetical protein